MWQPSIPPFFLLVGRLIWTRARVVFKLGFVLLVIASPVFIVENWLTSVSVQAQSSLSRERISPIVDRVGNHGDGLPSGLVKIFKANLVLETETATATPTEMLTPAETATETATETPTETPLETAIPSDTPTGTPTATAIPTETVIPSDTPTETPTATAIPTEIPSETSVPTDPPTVTDTPLPVETPIRHCSRHRCPNGYTTASRHSDAHGYHDSDTHGNRYGAGSGYARRQPPRRCPAC